MDKYLVIKKNRKNEVITLTYCDGAENHNGMQIVGKKSIKGFNINDILNAKIKFESKKYECELIKLNDYYNQDDFPNENIEDAYLLIIRKGIICLLDDNKEVDNTKIIDNLYDELTSFDWDRKYFCIRREKVLNKHARANVCFGDERQTPDYENKKGTIVPFSSVNLTNKIRKNLKYYLGETAENLQCEGNYYFDKRKCGIGYHGDTERKKVVGARIGEMNLKFNWFYKSKPIGKPINIELEDGDLYIMSEKTVGNDWKKKNNVTLRHSAGCDKYTKL